MKRSSVLYKTIDIDGVNIFYREAGTTEAAGSQSAAGQSAGSGSGGRDAAGKGAGASTKPAIVLLNGVPNSSSAFQQLMIQLKDDFYLVAPDFPGFGNSDVPDKSKYEYSFNNISLAIEKFIDRLGLVKPNVYALGYGGPIAFRIAMRRPAMFGSWILQNSNAFEEGLGPAMKDAAPYLMDRNAETEKLVKPLLTMEGIKLFYLHGAADATTINPDGYVNALHYLSRPGQESIQLDLLQDYASNIAEYPNWQAFLKKSQPRMLLVWGENDVFFPLAAAEAIKKAVPSAELHSYGTSHLALEEYGNEIAGAIREFLGVKGSMGGDAGLGANANPISYKTVKAGGMEVFYREAGPKDGPVVLLLHGYPTSSHMFRNLIPMLSAGGYRVIAPDLAGFGFTASPSREGLSGSPSREAFRYTFDNLTKVIQDFIDVLKLKRFAMYVFDYGAPVGWRLAVANPEKITGIISQNGNCYVEGLSEGWNPIKKYWADPSDENREALKMMTTPETTKWQYTYGAPSEELVAPESYTLDQCLLDRPGNLEIQLDLFRDYANNVKGYPTYQEYFRKKKPALLAVWGDKDPFFLPAGAEAFKRDLPDAIVKFYPAGHFALETHFREIGKDVLDFLGGLPE